MRSDLGALLAVFLLCAATPVAAEQVPHLPAAAVSVVQCIQRELKANGVVQSVSLYSIDGFRFAIEYTFKNKENKSVVSDFEFFAEGSSVIVGDKIPREVSMETAGEAMDLEEKLGLTSKCHFSFAFDNLLPQPKARADWQKIDWPNQ